MFKYFKNGYEITSTDYSELIADEFAWQGLPISAGKRVVTKNRQYARESGSYDLRLSSGTILRIVYKKKGC